MDLTAFIVTSKIQVMGGIGRVPKKKGDFYPSTKSCILLTLSG